MFFKRRIERKKQLAKLRDDVAKEAERLLTNLVPGLSERKRKELIEKLKRKTNFMLDLDRFLAYLFIRIISEGSYSRFSGAIRIPRDYIRETVGHEVFHFVFDHYAKVEGFDLRGALTEILAPLVASPPYAFSHFDNEDELSDALYDCDQMYAQVKINPSEYRRGYQKLVDILGDLSRFLEHKKNGLAYFFVREMMAGKKPSDAFFEAYGKRLFTY